MSGVGLDAVAAALLGALLCGGVAAADGGYFPENWAWIASLTFVSATMILIAGCGRRLGTLDVAFAALVFALGGWTLASGLWAPSVTSTVFEAQRTLAYLGVVLLGLVVVRRRAAPHLLGGSLAGVSLVAGYALLTRLLPDRLGSFDAIGAYRLSEPIGYWNGLGIYSAMGLLLSLGFLARGAHPVSRALAAALPVVLVTTQYFTFSRGAWVALAAGLGTVLMLDKHRMRYLVSVAVAAPWCLAAVAYASRADALTTRGATLAVVRSQGHAVLVVVGALALGAGISGLVLAFVDRRVQVRPAVRRVSAGAVAAVALAGLGVVWVQQGSPSSLARSAWSDFRSPVALSSDDLNSRLFTLSAHGRIDQWRVAWELFRRNPIGGEGAGAYAAAWAKHRPHAGTVHDAHSLYLETLGELGVIGAVLLLATLAVPLIAAVGARGSSIFPCVIGVLSAYAVHAGGDWDWELPGVTIVALLSGVAALVNAQTDFAPRRGAALSLPLAAAGCVVAVVSLLGALPLGRSRDAVDGSRWTAAEDAALSARRWAPWSSEPLRLLGEARLAQGDVTRARASFRAALRKDPERWELWLDLALASRGSERRAALDRARALNPLSPDVEELRRGRSPV